MFIEAIRILIKGSVTRFCIASNTVHLLLDDFKQETEIKFISMIDLVAKKCVQLNFKKVGLVGTPVTLNSRLYNKELEKYGIKAVLPTEDQKVVLDKIIRDILAGENNENGRGKNISISLEVYLTGEPME